MANTARPSGFRPVGHLQGLDWSEKIQWCYHPAALTSQISLYDCVQATSDGSDTTGTFAIATKAAEGSASNQQPILGVAVAFRSDRPDDVHTSIQGDNNIPRKEYCPASTEMYVGVVTDPYVVYEASTHTSYPLTATMIGNNFSIKNGALTEASLSGQLINTGLPGGKTTGAGTEAAQIRILKLAPYESLPGGNTLGASAKVNCLINNHFYKNTTGL